MQRHRAARLAVLLSLKTIDSKPDGVERTVAAGCIKPAAGMPAVQNFHDEMSSSTSKLMEVSSSIGGSETDGLQHPASVRSDESHKKESETRGNKLFAKDDSGLGTSIDVTEVASVLRLGSNESVIDEGDITCRVSQSREETAEKAKDSNCEHGGAMNGGMNRHKRQKDDDYHG